MTAWKNHERRCARMWGGERAGPLGAAVSDAVGVPVSLECKRSKRGTPMGAWIEQAKRQGAAEGLPWVLVVAGHNDRAPIAVVDHKWLVELARQAGLIDNAKPELRSVCPFGDVTCPCPDGLACHYEGHEAWPPPGAALS